eukprot:231855_1
MPFLIFLIFGLFLLSILGVTIVLSPSYNINCSIVLWLIHFATLYTLSPIIAMMWRIHKKMAINNNTDTSKHVSIKKLGNMFILIPSLILIIYLSLWTTIESTSGDKYIFYD